MRNENRNPEVRKVSRARYAQTEKGQATQARSRKARLKRFQVVATQEGRIVREFRCPHCGQSSNFPGNSAFVLRKTEVGEQFKAEDYIPNPDRIYKVPEAERRRQLAWYWRNREKVLARVKARRREVAAILSER